MRSRDAKKAAAAKKAADAKRRRVALAEGREKGRGVAAMWLCTDPECGGGCVVVGRPGWHFAGGGPLLQA